MCASLHKYIRDGKRKVCVTAYATAQQVQHPSTSTSCTRLGEVVRIPMSNEDNIYFLNAQDIHERVLKASSAAALDSAAGNAGQRELICSQASVALQWEVQRGRKCSAMGSVVQ